MQKRGMLQLIFRRDIDENDRRRVEGLAAGLSGKRSKLLNTFLLTPGRAKKMTMLYEAGFHYAPGGWCHRFIHSGRIHYLPSAVALAKKAVSQTP